MFGVYAATRVHHQRPRHITAGMHPALDAFNQMNVFLDRRIPVLHRQLAHNRVIRPVNRVPAAPGRDRCYSGRAPVVRVRNRLSPPVRKSHSSRAVRTHGHGRRIAMCGQTPPAVRPSGPCNSDRVSDAFTSLSHRKHRSPPGVDETFRPARRFRRWQRRQRNSAASPAELWSKPRMERTEVFRTR